MSIEIVHLEAGAKSGNFHFIFRVRSSCCILFTLLATFLASNFTIRLIWDRRPIKRCYWLRVT